MPKWEYRKSNDDWLRDKGYGYCPTCRCHFDRMIGHKCPAEPPENGHRKRDLFANIVWPNADRQNPPLVIGKQDLAAESDSTQGLRLNRNPLLLEAKMFLADIRTWRRQYRERDYVCADFAQEVIDAATDKGMRCGYVVIVFSRAQTGHAIIAFETDHGEKFFEPQSGNEVEIVAGRHYSESLEGVPADDVVEEIEIRWNDGAIERRR